MAKRTAISSILVIAAAASFDAAPVSADQPASSPDWAVSCHAGDDGFAVNCAATRTAGDYVLRLQTADSQLFVSILHPRCETNYRSFDRTDVAGLEAAERRALVERAFHEIEAEIRRTCPTLAPPVLALDAMPDIAIQAPAARAAADEFPQVARNCELPQAELVQFSGSSLRGTLLLPPELYARRGEQPVAGRIACIDHWALGRALRLFVAEARR